MPQDITLIAALGVWHLVWQWYCCPIRIAPSPGEASAEAVPGGGGPLFRPIRRGFLWGGAGLEAHLGLAVEDLRDDVFYPPPQAPGEASPPVCPHHPTFVTRSAAGLHPVPVHGGEVVLWRRPHHLKLAKAERRRGCPGAVGNRWVLAAGTVCLLLAATERVAAVPQREASDERRPEHPLPLRGRGMVCVASCRTQNSRVVCSQLASRLRTSRDF